MRGFGSVAQLVRATVSKTVGCRFESDHSPSKTSPFFMMKGAQTGVTYPRLAQLV